MKTFPLFNDSDVGYLDPEFAENELLTEDIKLELINNQNNTSNEEKS